MKKRFVLVLMCAWALTGSHLSADAETVKINGKQYFTYNKVYYQGLYGGSGMVYMVVEDPTR